MKLRKLFLIIFTICFTVALACVAVACADDGDGNEGEVIPVASVSLNKSELSLQVDGEETLEVSVNPRNATDKNATWKSSNESVATVDKGTVKGIAEGETTVTVTVGGKSASCTVTVTEKQIIHVTSITLTQNSLELVVNSTYTSLVPTIFPTNATEKTVTWTSSNPECVAVNNNGHLSALSVGTAVITAEADGKSDKCTVTVYDKVDSVTLSEEEVTLEVGGSTTITATVLPEGTTAEVVWTSSDNEVATVEDGVIYAVGTGTATITVKAGLKTAKCTVKVTETSVTSIELDRKNLTLTVGNTETLVATVDPEKAASSVIWESSNEDVATVVGGVVTAVNPGSATITAMAGDKSATCEVTVEASIASNSIVTYAHAGEESAAFEWDDNNAAGAKVQYKLSSASSYNSPIDSMLIRQISTGKARADILGLKGGVKYDFKITASDGTTVYALNVDIASIDRSGFAHANKSGVGAYNDDGTLKDNAVVIYVDEATKNNVVDSKGVAQGKSIAQYLAAASGNKNPIVVRVVGTVGSATWNEIKYTIPSGSSKLPASSVKGINGKQLPTDADSLTQAALISGGFNTLNTKPAKYKGATCLPINGLSSKATWDGKAYDSCWNDCPVTNVSNITVEGVGDNAEIFQWGLTFKNCSSVEVRNIRFFDYTEDACSFEGGGKPTKYSELNASYKNYWVHHNTFDIGMNYWDVCDEQDKGDGDGATDFKRLSHVTIAYNRYNGTHKTGLVGSGDDVYQAYFTFHHNYYNGCDQRMPLGRQANMHLYNNYYSGSGLYSISLRGSAYAYIENSVFTSKDKNTKPIELVKGSNGDSAAKVIDCKFDNNKIVNGLSSDNLYVGSDRTKTVSGDNEFLNFELKSGFYTVTGMLDKSEVEEKIPQVAGTYKRLSNIKIDGSSQGGGDSGGGTDTPNPNPGGDTENSKLTTIDDAVAAGKLTVSSSKQDLTDVELSDKISFTAKQTTVSKNSTTIKFDDGNSFDHRVILGKISTSNQRYFRISTDGAATIKVYVANLGSDGPRIIGLCTNKDDTDNSLIGTTTGLEKGDVEIVSISVSAKSDYYLISTAGDLSIFAIDIVESSGGDSGNTGTKAEQSISFTEAYNGSTVSGQFTSGDLFTATANASATVTKDPSTATADDGKTFDYGLFPGGTGFAVTVKASKSITLSIYYTVSNSSFASTNQSKGGTLVWSIGGDEQKSTNTANKNNAVAYCEIITLEANQEVIFSIDSTSNRLVLFGLFAVEQ